MCDFGDQLRENLARREAEARTAAEAQSAQGTEQSDINDNAPQSVTSRSYARGRLPPRACTAHAPDMQW